LGELAAASSPHRTRWEMWAAKESAFKAAKRIDPRLSFHPSAFSVELHDLAAARVDHAVGRFEVQLEVTPEYVHAVATLEGSPTASSKVGSLEGDSSASAQVRDLARLAVGSMPDVEPSQVEISRAGVPVVSIGGVVLPVELSLSHHGRFLACAWLWPERGDASGRSAASPSGGAST